MNALENSRYAKYVSERLDAKILENDYGFIVYQIKNKECFILEMFVDENFRNKNQGKSLCAELSKIALEFGASVITANVFLWDKNNSSTLIAALKFGFEITAANNNCILICKKIGG